MAEAKTWTLVHPVHGPVLVDENTHDDREDRGWKRQDAADRDESGKDKGKGKDKDKDK